MRTVGLCVAIWLVSAVAAAFVLIIGAIASGKTVQEGERALIGVAIGYLAIASGATALAARITRIASRWGRIAFLLVLVAGEVALLAVCSLGALVAFNR